MSGPTLKRTQRTSGPRLLRGLSGKLLVLTAGFVLFAEILIFFPSLGAARAEWLRERANAAQIAALALEAAPERQVSEDLSADLLANAQLVALALQRDEGRDLLLGPSQDVTGPLVTVESPVDDQASRIIGAVQTLLAPEGRFLRVVFPPPDWAPQGSLFMEMILPDLFRADSRSVSDYLGLHRRPGLCVSPVLGCASDRADYPRR